MSESKMKVELQKISSLKANPRNARIHSDAQIEKRQSLGCEPGRQRDRGAGNQRDGEADELPDRKNLARRACAAKRDALLRGCADRSVMLRHALGGCVTFPKNAGKRANMRGIASA